MVSISASGGVSSLSVFRKVVRLSVLCLCIIPTEAELLLAFLFGAALIINSAALRFIPFEKMEAEGYGYLLFLFD